MPNRSELTYPTTRADWTAAAARWREALGALCDRDLWATLGFAVFGLIATASLIVAPFSEEAAELLARMN
jgi:hypothetical protein